MTEPALQQLPLKSDISYSKSLKKVTFFFFFHFFPPCGKESNQLLVLCSTFFFSFTTAFPNFLSDL